MRTLIIIVIGLVLAGLALRLTPPARRGVALVLFSAAWLVACLLNLRTGLSHGYTLAQEVPIHLVLFGVPVAFAWWLSRGAKPRGAK